jgi:hypothetical protein
MHSICFTPTVPLLVVALLTLCAHSAVADVYALGAPHRSSVRLQAEVDSLYLPMYQVAVTARAGDILRVAGFLEVSERGGKRNKVFAYLAARPFGSSGRSRISSEARQVANSNQNHHMALNLFGSYIVPSSGEYLIELLVSNSLSGRDRQLNEAPAVGDPTHLVQIGTGHRVAVGERQRRPTFQGGVAACRVVVGLEFGKLPFKIKAVPEQHMIQEFSAHRPNQALHERM